MSHRQIWTDPTTPEKKGSRYNLHHAGSPIHGSVPSFSLKPTNKAVDLNQAFINDKLLGLLGPYISMRSVCSTLARGGQPIGS
jgi:hypothetical protein